MFDAPPVSPPPAAPPAVVAQAQAGAAPRPPISWDPIPFPKTRVDAMRAYARRHYGLNRARLLEPKVVVEHLTVTTTWEAAFNTFAADVPDPELHERPGTCAHFVVDQRGTIHQLVSLKWMCRHTVGLNWTAIGIEHVGMREADVLGHARQLRASLRLTRWLQGRFAIATKDVIGHRESLSSPYHQERVERLRAQTHGDFPRSVMRRYRKALAGG